MKAIICGGRRFANVALIWKWLDGFHAETPISEVMTGGATGVDNSANAWAQERQVLRHQCLADWPRYGKAAGPMRNRKMLEWGPDLVIAFSGGPGTADMVMRAKAAKVKVIEV